MSLHLVFRGKVLNSRQLRKEIGTLRPELVFRDNPGNSVQRRRHSARGIVAGVARELAIVEAPLGGVLAVP